MAIEIPNPVVMVTFTAANPPLIKGRSGNVSSVSRSNAGQYIVHLTEELPGDVVDAPVNLQCSCLAGVASFAGAAEDGSGNIAVETRSLAGAFADTGAVVSVVAYLYPSVN